MVATSTGRVDLLPLGVGYLCIGLGIGSYWIVTAIFSYDGTIDGPIYAIAIAIWSLVLVALGLSTARRDRHLLRETAVNVGVASVSLVFALAIAELGLRVFPPAILEPTIQASMMIENPYGTGSYRLASNHRRLGRQGSLSIVMDTNSKAMRGREVTVEKPTNKKRIAFLGDSFTFGSADSVQNSFVGVFESLVDTSLNQVLNFGVGGYSTPDELLQLKEQVMPFRPDVVFVCFYAGNDMFESYFGLHRKQFVDGSWTLVRDYSRIPETLRPDRARPEPSTDSSLRLMSLLGYGNRALYADLRRTTSLYQQRQLDLTVSEDFTEMTFWCRADYPPVALAAVDTVLAAFEGIREVCEKEGIQLLIIGLPATQQVFAKHLRGPGYDANRPQSFVARYAKTKGIPYLDMLPTMRSYARRSDEKLFWDDGHLDNHGNFIIGMALATFYQAVAKTEFETDQ